MIDLFFFLFLLSRHNEPRHGNRVLSVYSISSPWRKRKAQAGKGNQKHVTVFFVTNEEAMVNSESATEGRAFFFSTFYIFFIPKTLPKTNLETCTPAYRTSSGSAMRYCRDLSTGVLNVRT
jgi:hypothetical protein